MGVLQSFCDGGVKDEDGFDQLRAGCLDGTYRSRHYIILQILPDLIVAQADADRPFWFVNIAQYSPIAVDRTAFRSWSFPTPFAEDISWFGRATRPVTDLFRHPIYFHYYKQVVRQDIEVCERLQKVAHQVDQAPMLGALEKRIEWFENSIRKLMTSNRQETETKQ